MKNILAICFVVWGFSPAFAQKDSTINYKPVPGAFISVNAGIGLPTNWFYIQGLSPYEGQYKSGYAYTGYTVNTLGAIPLFHSSFSLAGFISFNSEPFDVRHRFQDLYEDWSDMLISSSSSNFKESLFMAGFFYTLPGKSNFTFKILAGYNMCTLAGYSLTKTETPPTRIPETWVVTESLQPSNSSSMAFDFGMSIRVLQKRHFFGLVNCDFMYSQAYFNSTYTTTEDSYTELNGPDHFRVTYNLLSVTVGVGYKI